ncbi:hypothetical protein DSBG_3619 [Desulfosporosinus sp. BG]|nr:hypothetical protein DSBG_3619 [Desulfosporosinus sp. BG]
MANYLYFITQIDVQTKGLVAALIKDTVILLLVWHREERP